MNSQQVTINVPDEYNISESVEKVLRELLAPVAKLEELKRKEDLTAKEVELLYNIKATSLSTWRCRGGGPEYEQAYKNGPVTYKHQSIQEFRHRNKMLG